MSSDRTFGRVRFAANHYAAATIALVGSSIVGLAGCFTIAEGVPPPLDEFYYPTGVVVSPGRTTLYVVNSDFDLQYSGGTVQALDLVALREKGRGLRDALNEGASMQPPRATADACAAQSPALTANDNTTLYPGPCSPVAFGQYVKSVATIGAFASGATLALTNPCEIVDKDKGLIRGRGARLFVPVRGDPSVTYFDVTDDRDVSCGSPAMPLERTSPCGNPDDPAACLSCGATTNGERCSSSYLVGKDPSKNPRGLTLPVEPVGIDVDDRGESIVVAHQSDATVSLIVNRWDSTPMLAYYLTGLSIGPTDIASLPIPRIIEDNGIDYTPAFVVSYRAAPEFTLLRYEDDGGARPFLTRGASSGVATTASATDSRGVAIDGAARRACEDACGEADRNACLRACAETHPLGVYMANRAPAALVIGRVETKFAEGAGANGVEVTGAYELPSFQDSVPLAFGASRIEIGHVVDTQGRLSRRVFAVTFDSRFVFSYDPEARRVDAIIRTGRGPHAIAFDSGEEMGSDGKMHPYATMYVAHFTDSYVGVVDLDMNNRATFGSIYMTLGQPVPPKGSQ